MSKAPTIGLVIRPEGLAWTSRAPAGGAVLQRKSPPRAGQAERPADWSQGFDEALGLEASRLKGQVHLAIPSDALLLRVLDLPTSDDAEIAGMVELQADQYSPFPVDALYLSWEVLVRKEGRSRVLLAGVRRSVVDRLGEAASRHRVRLHRIDADILCWLRLLRDAHKIPGQGRHLVVVDDARHPMLVVMEDGHPLFLRALSVPGPDDPGRAAILAEEASLAMAEVEAEWGAEPLAGVLVAHWGAEPQGFHVLRRECAAPMQTASLGALDPLSDGVSVRADSPLDLSPVAWKEEAAAHAQRLRALRIAGVAAAIWLVGWGIFLSILAVRRGQMESLKGEVDTLAKPAEEAKALERELAFLNAFTNRNENVLDCMLEVVRTLPAGTQLTDFQFRKATGLSVSGTGPTQAVLAYTQGLGSSPLFRDPDPEVANGKFRFNVKLASAVAAERDARP